MPYSVGRAIAFGAKSKFPTWHDRQCDFTGCLLDHEEVKVKRFEVRSRNSNGGQEFLNF